MCLITSMLRKQGLIVIWGRAHAAAPAHWWILMMSVFLTVCYTNTGGGWGWAGGRWGGGGCVPRQPYSASVRKLQSQVFSLKTLSWCSDSFAAWKHLRHHRSCSSCGYCRHCFVVATFSLSFFHPSVHPRIFRISNNSPPSWRRCHRGCVNYYWKIAAKSPLICIRNASVNLISGSGRRL